MEPEFRTALDLIEQIASGLGLTMFEHLSYREYAIYSPHCPKSDHYLTILTILPWADPPKYRTYFKLTFNDPDIYPHPASIMTEANDPKPVTEFDADDFLWKASSTLSAIRQMEQTSETQWIQKSSNVLQTELLRKEYNKDG